MSNFNNDDREFKRAAIEAALDYIDPSNLSRDEWLRVLMALHCAKKPLPFFDNGSLAGCPTFAGKFVFHIDKPPPL